MKNQMLVQYPFKGKTIATSALHEVNHQEYGQNANKAWDKAKSFISIKITSLVLYFM